MGIFTLDLVLQLHSQESLKLYQEPIKEMVRTHKSLI